MQVLFGMTTKRGWALLPDLDLKCEKRGPTERRARTSKIVVCPDFRERWVKRARCEIDSEF